MKRSVPTRGSVTARLVTWFPALCFLACAALYYAALGRYLSANLAPVVAQVASQSLHRQVAIGRLTAFGIPGLVTLRDVRISNSATFDRDRGAALLSAGSVTIHYSPDRIFFQANGASSGLGDIDIDGATAYVERLGVSKFNFSDLLPLKPKHDVAPYVGTVTASNSIILFQDVTGPPDYRRLIDRFTHVNARIDLRSRNTVYFRVGAASPTGLFRTAVVTGDVLRNLDPAHTLESHQGMRVHVRMADASAPFFVGYFLGGIRPYVQVAAGKVDVDVTISKLGSITHKGPLDVQGFAHVKGGRAFETRHMVFKQPLENVAGDVFFSLNGATLSVSGTTNGIPVNVNGSVFGFPKVSLALNATSSSVVIARLPGAFTFIPDLRSQVAAPAAGVVSLSVAGPLDDLEVHAAGGLPFAVVAGTRFENIRASMTYAHGLVAFNTITASHKSTGGSLTAVGLIDTRTWPASVSFSGTASNVDLAGLPMPSSTIRSIGTLRGVADADFMIGYGRDGGRGGAVKVDANYRMRDITLHGYMLTSIGGRAEWTYGEPVRLTDLVAQDAGGGVLYASGAVPVSARSSQPLNLRVNAVRIRMAPLLNVLGVSGASGEAFFSGRVAGTMVNPTVAGHLALISSRYGRYALDLGDGNVSYRSGLLTFKNVRLDLDPAVATVNGTIAAVDTRNPRLALSVVLGRAEVSDLIALIPRSAIASAAAQSPSLQRLLDTTTGTLDSRFQIGGTFLAPTLSGSVAVYSATMDAYEVDDAKGTFSVAGNVVTVPDLLVHWENASIDIRGNYDLAHSAADATFDATGLDTKRIADLDKSIDLPVSGVAAVSGSIKGNIANPTVVATVHAGQLSIAGLQIGPLAASVALDNGVVSSSQPVTFTFGDGAYVVTAYRYDAATGEIGLSAHLDHATIADTISTVRSNSFLMGLIGDRMNTLLGALPGPVNGDLAVRQFDVTGTDQHPAVSLVADLTNLTIGASEVKSVHADLSYVDNTFKVNSIKARGNQAYLSAEGSVDLGGPIDAHVEASGIPLAVLNPFLPTDRQVGGTIGDFTVEASGLTKAPSLIASITLDNPSIGGFAFDRIDSGRIQIANNELVIDGLTVTKDEPVAGGEPIEHVASVRGILPFEWTRSGVLAPSFPPTVPIAMHASIPEQNLSVLSLFFPKIAPDNLTGTLSANIDVGGTLQNKSLTGNISIAKGTFAASGFATGLKNIDLSIGFNGNHAFIQTATADSSAGDTVVGKVGQKVVIHKGEGPVGGTLSVTGDMTFGQSNPAPGESIADTLIGGVQVNLAATASKFAVNEPKLTQYGDAGLSGIVDGTVKITEALIAPRVEGGLAVSNLVGTLPSQNTEALATPPPPLINPHFHLSLAIAPGAQLKAPQLQASTAGSFSLLGTLDKPYLHGNLTINSGKFLLPTAVFKLARGGNVEVTYNPQTAGDIQTALDEHVDLTATAAIHISPEMLAANQPGIGSQMQGSSTFLLTSTNIGTQRYLVTIHILGSLTDPDRLKLEFTSDPAGLTQQDILAALGGDEFNQFASGSVYSAVTGFVAQALSTSLSDKVLANFSEALGLEDFSVDYSPDAPLSLTIAKQLSNRLDFTFVRYVNSRTAGAVASTLNPLQYQLKLGYNLTDRLDLRLSTDDQRDNSVGIEGVLHF